MREQWPKMMMRRRAPLPARRRPAFAFAADDVVADAGAVVVGVAVVGAAGAVVVAVGVVAELAKIAAAAGEVAVGGQCLNDH